MNSSRFAAIQALVAVQSPADLDRALPDAAEAAAPDAVRERHETGLPNRRAFDLCSDVDRTTARVIWGRITGSLQRAHVLHRRASRSVIQSTGLKP